MKERKQHMPDDAAVSRALTDAVLEASDSELTEILGKDEFAALASRGRAAMSRALGQLSKKMEEDSGAESLHRGLGVLLQLLRRREGLSEIELAERARVEEEEIRRIEFDPQFIPNPRTIHQLEGYFKLPRRTLVVLSGSVRVQKPELREGVIRFAAHSAALGKLSKEEKRLLNDFVRFLKDCSDE